MKVLPKVVKGSANELSNKSITPIVASIVAGVLAGVSMPAIASTSSGTNVPLNQSQATVNHTPQQTNTAIIMAKPSLDGQVFAAHYSHSSHSSHSSHYSCTPGSTC